MGRKKILSPKSGIAESNWLSLCDQIWSTSNYGLIGSLQSTLDVRTMAVSSELVYLGCKAGSIEVWCKKEHTRVETLHTNSTAKILCMAFDANQDILLVGTSHGTIQVPNPIPPPFFYVAILSWVNLMWDDICGTYLGRSVWNHLVVKQSIIWEWHFNTLKKMNINLWIVSPWSDNLTQFFV